MSEDSSTTVESEPDPWAGLGEMLQDEAEHLNVLREAERQRLWHKIPRAFSDGLRSTERSLPSQKELFGLALSGGGIRSATFSLGVLQALAQRKRIGNIDYISTVSGGGYIGAWLSACIYRARLAGSSDPIGTVETRITTRNIRREADEASEVRFLRAYSNYLTPRLGFFSGDTLAAMSGLLRNLLLNLSLGVYCILLILAFFHSLIAIMVAQITTGDVSVGGFGLLYSVGFAAAPLSFFMTLQSHNVRTLKDSNYKKVILFIQHYPRVCVLVPLALSLILGSIWLCFNANSIGVPQIALASLAVTTGIVVGWIAAYVLLQFEALLQPDALLQFDSLKTVGRLRLAGNLIYSSARTAIQDSKNELPRYGVAILACTAAIYALAFIGSSLYAFRGFNVEHAIHIMALGPGVGAAALWVLFLIWMGIVANTYSEFTREWLNRFLGELAGLGALWLIVSGLIVHARPIAQWALANWYYVSQQWSLTTVLGIAIVPISIAGVLFWHLRKPREEPAEAETPFLSVMMLCWVIIISFIFTLTVFFQSILLRVANKEQLVQSTTYSDILEKHIEQSTTYSDILEKHIESLALALSLRSGSWLNPMGWPFVMPAITLFIIIGIVAWCGFRLIDVNTFSLQNLYRNRLVRCYLGAAHGVGRLANPYAGFDPRDDFELKELAEQRPYLLVSAALNITQGQDLAWQQRKAASFLFSPRWCGYWLQSTELSSMSSRNPTRGGYVKTDQYVQESAGFRSVSEGLMVGTAIATSGAAVSSQMGFASRGPLAFVLTLMNLRLGRWLPNSGKKTKELWKAASPNIGTYWYFRELLGLTNERSDWIYVSDGGHFENLGVYELVRRRCTHIFCVDAGADPKRTFADLGNAVQKCRVDFGVDIRIDVGPLRIDSSGISEEAYQIGTIEYPATEDAKGFTGELLYIKPSLARSWKYLPSDLLAYSARHSAFPHEATTNQWFSESQFESYRHLGYVIALRALDAVDGWRGPRRSRKKRAKPSSATI